MRATLVSPGRDRHGAVGRDSILSSRDDLPAPAAMLRPDDVARAVLFAVQQPAAVNVDELRITRA